MKRSLVALVAAFGVLVLLPGLAAAAAPSGSGQTLAPMLLRLSQMPKGWVVNKSAGTISIGCLGRELEPAGTKQSASAEVSYEARQGFPGIVEKLATYSGGAPAAFRKIEAGMNACGSFRGALEGHAVTGTVAPMAFPRLSNQSVAYKITVHIAGATLVEDVVIVRKSAIVAGIAEANVGAPSLAQLERFAGLALARLP